MSYDYIAAGLLNFINIEIMPKASITEKCILAAESSLNLLNKDAIAGALTSNALLKKSSALNPDGSLNHAALRNAALAMLAVVGSPYRFPGFPIDMVITKVVILEGFYITEVVVDSFFNCLDAALQQQTQMEAAIAAAQASLETAAADANVAAAASTYTMATDATVQATTVVPTA